MMAMPSFTVLAFENLGQPDVRAADIFVDDVTTALARADDAHLLALTAPAGSRPRAAPRRRRTARSGAGLAAR